MGKNFKNLTGFFQHRLKKIFNFFLTPKTCLKMLYCGRAGVSIFLKMPRKFSLTPKILAGRKFFRFFQYDFFKKIRKINLSPRGASTLKSLLDGPLGYFVLYLMFILAAQTEIYFGLKLKKMKTPGSV